MRKNEQKSDFISILRQWSHIAGYSDRKILNRELGLSFSLPQVVEYTLDVPAEYGLDGKTMFFFSDLHYGKGSDEADIYIDILLRINPDWIVFGGDLTTYACSINAAFEWLKRISLEFPDVPKIAVPGNWDRRRKSWFPQKIWNDNYKQCGFHWLINKDVFLDGIHFYGIDDSRLGNPEVRTDLMVPDSFNCILSHSVEPVIDALNHLDLPGRNIVLCGHSHGGQIRIPFFGALLTSSKYWKLFEYGLYRKKKSGTELLMTSGIGTSRFPFRIFCPPEVVAIRFYSRNNSPLS
jgi:predicted MPP superfamily phosphohydrolase